jgi:threonine/homoserine/homoserine lactone efflux protein
MVECAGHSTLQNPNGSTAGRASRHTRGMTHAAPVLLSIGILWSAAAIAPGPNFVIVTRTALLHSWAAALRATLGIAGGAIVWGLAGFFGVHALFTLAPWLYVAMKLGGSAWLVLLGLRYVRTSFRADTALRHDMPIPPVASMRLGFLTSVANPQSAVSTASLFAATLPEHPSLGLGLAAISLMAGIAIVWYALVACVLTLRPAAAVFARLSRWIDRLACVAFIGLGTRLALER